jgi:hypothetical protein
MIGGTVDFGIIGENWDETLRLATSIKAGTVARSALMRRHAAYLPISALGPKQRLRHVTLLARISSESRHCARRANLETKSSVT